MSTGSPTRDFKNPTVSSMSTKTDNTEDDAALVDSFFLPGGLFSDESNSNNQNESNIANKHNLHIDSMPHTTTSRASVHLPKNPWETETSNKITVQLEKSSTGSSARLESLCMQPLRLSLSSTNSNDDHERHLGYDDTTFNNITGNINHFDVNRKHRGVEDENMTETKRKTYFHQETDAIFPQGNQNQKCTNIMNDSKRVVRPPPGFQNDRTVIPSVDATFVTNLTQQHSNNGSMEFLATPSTSTGNKYLFPSSDGRMGTVIGKKVLFDADDSCDVSPQKSKLPDLSMTCLQHTFQQSVSLPSNNMKAIELEISELNVPISAQSDKYNNEESSSYLVRYLKKPTSSSITLYHNREGYVDLEALVFSRDIGSEGKSRKSNDYVENNYGDDAAEADVQEEDTEENSIPSNICASINAESNSSSLSTCSEVDNNSELSSHTSDNNHLTNDDDFKDEGVGYDTDQAHVSQIVGVLGDSLCSSVGNDGIPDDEQPTSPAPNVNSEGATRRTTSVDERFLHGYNDQNNSNITAEQMITFLRSTVECCHSLVDNTLLAMRRSLLYAMATKRYERFFVQMRKVSRDIHNFANWLIDVEEVFTVLLIRSLKVGWKYSRDITEVLAMILSFLFQLLKFGLIEAIEEFSGVTSCYIVFYLMPRTCVMLMDYINLPHWTPHTITWLAIFSLCHQVEAGTLHETSNCSMLLFISKLRTDLSVVPATTSNNGITAEYSSTNTRPSPPSRQRIDEATLVQDKQVCFLLLKILKTILPVLFMVEGFSSEFGTIIGVNSTNRLTTAFVLSILRKSLLSSPIAWLSWALQILLAVYYPYCSWLFLDLLILLIGLSSIRLIRFIDLQRLQGKRRCERSNK